MVIHTSFVRVKNDYVETTHLYYHPSPFPPKGNNLENRDLSFIFIHFFQSKCEGYTPQSLLIYCGLIIKRDFDNKPGHTPKGFYDA